MDDANILQSFFFTQINRNPDQEAVYDFESGAHYTYRDLGVRACRLANFLKQELKILPNDRIAILSKWAILKPSSPPSIPEPSQQPTMLICCRRNLPA